MKEYKFSLVVNDAVIELVGFHAFIGILCLVVGIDYRIFFYATPVCLLMVFIGNVGRFNFLTITEQKIVSKNLLLNYLSKEVFLEEVFQVRIIKGKRWGRKELAFDMNKQLNTFYVNVSYLSDKDIEEIIASFKEKNLFNDTYGV